MVRFNKNSKSKRVQRLEARKRAKFWDKWGEPIRVTMIGAASIAGATLLAKMMLG